MANLNKNSFQASSDTEASSMEAGRKLWREHGPFGKLRSIQSLQKRTLPIFLGQTTQGLPNGGRTTHYQISYDISLSTADGLTRAQQLFNTCEFDFDLMSSWFKGVDFKFSLPINVQINNASGGASWDDPSDFQNFFGYSPTVQINPGSGTGVDFVRYLLVAEVTEMFMASKNNGWFGSTSAFSGANEGSKGEGLSRFLSRQFMLANNLQNVRYPNFEVVSLWFNSSRPDYVDNNPDDIQPDIITGCTTCFLYYLHDQLGFKITDIINAGAATMSSVYTNLTGRTDGWQSFINLVNSHYPIGPTYNPVGDDLFPVPNLAYIGLVALNQQMVSGSTRTFTVSLDTQAPAETVVSLTSDNPAVLIVPARVTVQPGSPGQQVNIQAAPVIGPAQTVNVHATYAGEEVSQAIQILPSPSILQGQVTDTASKGISDAFVLLQSDTIITPTTGDSLQLSTDANGFYTTPDIPPHAYQVSAGQDGYVTGAATVTIAVGAPSTTQNFTLETVKAFTINGKVTDISGPPIAGATVALGSIKTKTDASGNYSISFTPFDAPNTYPLTASYPGYTFSSVALTIPNGATVTQNFVLARLGSLTGVISDASKTPTKPIAGATVSVGTLKVISDSSGHYTLTGLNPGMNNVTVSATGFDTAHFSVPVVSGAVTPQDFSLMEGSAVLTGTVNEEDTGAPLNARISILAVASVTAVDGVYTISGIPAGQQEVTVSLLRHVTQNELVQFSAHQTVKMDFTLFSTRNPKPPRSPSGQPE